MVVKDVTFGIFIGAAILRPGVFRVAIFTEAGFWTEILWKILVAFAIDHADSFWVCRTTGAMHHALCDGLIQHGMSCRVRDLSGDDGVNVSGIADLVRSPQEDEQMDVRQTTLLELNGEDIALDVSKNTILDVFEHSLDFLSEYTGHDVWAIRGGLLFLPLIGIIIIWFIR